MQKLTIEQAREQFYSEFELSEPYLETVGSIEYDEIQGMLVSWLRCLRANGLLVESET